MRLAGDQIETAVLVFDALDLPAAGHLVGAGGSHGDVLDLLVADHGREAGRGAVRVRQDPGPAKVLDVADGAVPLLLQFVAAALQAAVQFVQTVLDLLLVGLKEGRIGLRLLKEGPPCGSSAGRSGC